MTYLRDLINAHKTRDFWIYYSIQKLRARYSFSVFGTAWVFLSFAIFAGGMSFMHYKLFGKNFYESLLYVSSGFLVWNYITGIILQSGGIYREFRGFLLNSDMTPLVPICVIVFRNLVTFSMQCSVFAFAFALCEYKGVVQVEILPAIGGFVAAIAAVSLFGFLMASVISLLGIYLPDINEILASLIRFLFFLSPIIWPQQTFSGGALSVVSLLNPLGASVALTRIPLNAQGALAHSPLLTLGGYSAVCIVFLALFYNRFRRFISVWT